MGHLLCVIRILLSLVVIQHELSYVFLPASELMTRFSSLYRKMMSRSAVRGLRPVLSSRAIHPYPSFRAGGL